MSDCEVMSLAREAMELPASLQADTKGEIVWLAWFAGALALAAIVITIRVWRGALNAQDFMVAHSVVNDPLRLAHDAERKKLTFTMFASVVIVVILGAFVWVAFLLPDLNTRQQEARKALYLNGYEQGWKDQCEWVFFTMLDTPNGVLFNGNVPYDKAWCQALQPAPEGLPATFGADSYERGKANAGLAVDAVSARVGILCFADECIDVQSAWFDWLDMAMDYEEPWLGFDGPP